MIATMFYCLGIPSAVAAAHLRASVRNIRNDPDSALVCIETIQSGPQTCIISGEEEMRDRVLQAIGKSVRLGACQEERDVASSDPCGEGNCQDPAGECNRRVYCFVNPCSFATCGYGTVCRSNYCGGCNAVCEPETVDIPLLTTKQKKLVTVCLQSGDYMITTLLPRVIRRKIGARRGRCNPQTAQIEIKIADIAVQETKSYDLADCKADVSIEDLTGRWNVKQIRLGESLEQPLEGYPITMKFDEDGFSGDAGCNLLFGGFTTESISGLTIGAVPGIASTKMYCHPVMGQENAFVSRMSKTPYSYRICNNGNRLELYETNVSDREAFQGDLFAVSERIPKDAAGGEAHNQIVLL